MNLAAKFNGPAANSSQGRNEDVRRLCQQAKELEDAGNYNDALEALSDVWSGVGEKPVLEGLDKATTAELLLRAGSLIAHLGAGRRVENALEKAVELLKESACLFEELALWEGFAGAQLELAACYRQAGALSAAGDVLRRALNCLPCADDELRAATLLGIAENEAAARRYSDALLAYAEAASLAERSTQYHLKGRFHSGLAGVLINLGMLETRQDYIDKAFLEYTKAGLCYECAGHTRHFASVEAQLGMAYLSVGMYAEAHNHLQRARRLFAQFKDTARAAQVDEAYARMLLAEGRNIEAERTAGLAVRALKRAGDEASYVEALTTHATALARLGHHARARQTLQLAVETARSAGNSEGACRATLTLIEELSDYCDLEELSALYEGAADLFRDSPAPYTMDRLIACARKLLRISGAHHLNDETPVNWEGFSFKNEILRYERLLIEKALKDAGGRVTRAAHLLGLKHYGSLTSLINARHQELLNVRTPVIHRRRSIIKKTGERRKKSHAAGK